MAMKQEGVAASRPKRKTKTRPRDDKETEVGRRPFLSA